MFESIMSYWQPVFWTAVIIIWAVSLWITYRFANRETPEASRAMNFGAAVFSYGLIWCVCALAVWFFNLVTYGLIDGYQLMVTSGIFTLLLIYGDFRICRKNTQADSDDLVVAA